MVWPAGLRRFGEKRYGETCVWFAELGGAVAPDGADVLAEPDAPAEPDGAGAPG